MLKKWIFGIERSGEGMRRRKIFLKFFYQNSPRDISHFNEHKSFPEPFSSLFQWENVASFPNCVEDSELHFLTQLSGSLVGWWKLGLFKTNEWSASRKGRKAEEDTSWKRFPSCSKCSDGFLCNLNFCFARLARFHLHRNSQTNEKCLRVWFSLYFFGINFFQFSCPSMMDFSWNRPALFVAKWNITTISLNSHPRSAHGRRGTS